MNLPVIATSSVLVTLNPKVPDKNVIINESFETIAVKCVV
jgi:hypothetical protein